MFQTRRNTPVLQRGQALVPGGGWILDEWNLCPRCIWLNTNRIMMSCVLSKSGLVSVTRIICDLHCCAIYNAHTVFSLCNGISNHLLSYYIINDSTGCLSVRSYCDDPLFNINFAY